MNDVVNVRELKRAIKEYVKNELDEGRTTLDPVDDIAEIMRIIDEEAFRTEQTREEET